MGALALGKRILGAAWAATLAGCAIGRQLLSWYAQQIELGYRALRGSAGRRIGLMLVLVAMVLSGLLGDLANAGIGVIPTAQAYGMLPHRTPSQPSVPNKADPKAGTQSKNRPYHPAPMGNTKQGAPQSISHAGSRPLKVGEAALAVGKPTTFLSADGRLEFIVPGTAITTTDVEQAGGKITLQITQIAPPSGSNAGGSGHFSLGTYLIQLVDAKGTLVDHGLGAPLTIRYHFSKQERMLDLSRVAAIMNSDHVATGVGAPLPAGMTAATAMRHPSRDTVQVDHATHTLTVSPLISTPSSTLSFQGDASVSTFGKPDPFAVDLNAGGLTANQPIEVPPGPGGLTPPILLAYNSEGVNGQHNPAAAAGWVGEGWSLGLGSINWSEHNVTATCPTTCTPTWESTWQISDPYGTAGEIIPPNINVSTFYDDTGWVYCGDSHATSSNSYPCPILWHTANESHVKIYSYVGPVNIGMPSNPPCFRAWLPNGIMEEFGCTADSLQYYYIPGVGFAVTSWNLDLVIDPAGNQIHILYQADTASTVYNNTTYYYPRDEVLSRIEYDDPTCHNAQARCTTWNPNVQILFNAGHAVVRQTRRATVLASSSWESPDNNSMSLAHLTDGQETFIAGNTGWTSGLAKNTQPNHNEWVRVDLGALQTISEVDLYPRSYGSTTLCFPVDFTIDVSTNGVTWTSVVTKTNYPTPTAPTKQAFPFTAQTARYVRVKGTRLSPDQYNNYYMQFAEFEVLNPSGQNLALDATPVLAAPTVATASSDLETADGTFSIANVTDGDEISYPGHAGYSSTAAASNHTEWIYVDLGSSQAVNEVDLYPHSGGSTS